MSGSWHTMVNMRNMALALKRLTICWDGGRAKVMKVSGKEDLEREDKEKYFET